MDHNVIYSSRPVQVHLFSLHIIRIFITKIDIYNCRAYLKKKTTFLSCKKTKTSIIPEKSNYLNQQSGISGVE